MYVQMREADRVGLQVNNGGPRRDYLSLGIFLLDEFGLIRYCNERLLRKIETTFERIYGNPIAKFIPDFSFDVKISDLGLAAAAVAEKPKLAWLHSANGGVAMVRFTAQPIFRKGKSSLVVVVEEINAKAGSLGGRDIASLMAGADEKVDAVLITDCSGNIEFANRAFELMTGFSRADMVGRTVQSAKIGLSDYERNPRFWRDIRCGKSFSGISVHCKKDGSRFHHEQSVRPFFDPTGVVTHAVFTGHDVTEREIAMRHMARQANYDSLTNLPNRNLLSDRLQQVLKHAERSCDGFVVAMFDVDDFKSINDTYGHSVGDLVLCRIARCVESCIRTEDTLGRLGGDEFVLILPGIGRREDAEDVINKISDSFSNGLIVKEKLVNVSLSVGLAIYPFDGSDPKNLLEVADKEMYKDKKKLAIRRSAGLRN